MNITVRRELEVRAFYMGLNKPERGDVDNPKGVGEFASVKGRRTKKAIERNARRGIFFFVCPEGFDYRDFPEDETVSLVWGEEVVVGEAGDEKPDWWPQNPYPPDIFVMPRDRYAEIVPDPNLRTALSGCLGRVFWDIASDMIWDRFRALKGE